MLANDSGNETWHKQTYIEKDIRNKHKITQNDHLLIIQVNTNNLRSTEFLYLQSKCQTRNIPYKTHNDLLSLPQQQPQV